MYKNENSTQLIKFRVTPGQRWVIQKAVELQKNRRLRDLSKCCRALVLQWANAVIAEAQRDDTNTESGESAGKKGAGNEG